mmetsp:Transcript_4655/g.29416  ORF Transcript_4655/g.29416 Transcript_4655/m.29416 type:complete len:219 (-) Transcript_4655:14-670(-)
MFISVAPTTVRNFQASSGSPPPHPSPFHFSCPSWRSVDIEQQDMRVMGLGTLATLTQPCLPEVGSLQVPPRSKALPKSAPSTPATVSLCTVLWTHHRSASTPAADTAQQLPQCPWSSTVAPHPNHASLASKLSGTSPSVHRSSRTSLAGFPKGVAACTTAATVRIVAKVFAIRGGAAMAEEAHVTRSSDPATLLQPRQGLLRPLPASLDPVRRHPRGR